VALGAQIVEPGHRIERLNRQVRHQIAFIDCLQRNDHDMKPARLALDAMQAELSLLPRYRVSLCRRLRSSGGRERRYHEVFAVDLQNLPFKPPYP
jgi:hypothetical protein